MVVHLCVAASAAIDIRYYSLLLDVPCIQMATGVESNCLNLDQQYAHCAARLWCGDSEAWVSCSSAAGVGDRAFSAGGDFDFIQQRMAATVEDNAKVRPSYHTMQPPRPAADQLEGLLTLQAASFNPLLLDYSSIDLRNCGRTLGRSSTGVWW